MNSKQLVSTGRWGDIFEWKMYVSTDIPPIELCTTVACVALTGKNLDEVVLTRNHRGWEVPAGHIEPGETIQQALHREALEEGGFIVSTSIPFGFRKITATRRPKAGSRQAAYPFPDSYIVYFVAYTDQPIARPTGIEIIESRTYTPNQLKDLIADGALDEVNQEIIRLGLHAAQQ